MNIKKMFTALSAMVVAVTMTMPSVSVFGATYSDELIDAYNWAHDKGITTMATIDDANMYSPITRAEMAKMLSVYAKETLGKELDTSAACTFTDIDSVKGDLHDFIIESCQLGIMGQNMPNNAFRPYDTISRAEFGTALSRVLWGDEYNGGTPYYANHLNALKSAAIMNQIANAESTKEIRGYVMLMLMRAEQGGATVDCEEPTTALACLDPELDAYKDCPAACREDASDTVVKSGDLSVTAKATEGRRARVPGVSDLDTLTFKTSEDVTITKVVLERYGYSTQDDVDEVRLEDQDGNVIADGKSLTKDKVTLSIKKDYRSVDGTFVATVVAKLTGSNVGGTIGFKVVDAESSAKNLNLDDYTPYTYEMVQYSGNTVTVDIKGTDGKNYNYEEGESYEIARLKVKAGGSIIYVKGFTLTNNGNLDMADFLDKLTVTVDGKEVEGLKYSVNKDDQLVISFDEMTIDMNKSALFVISASLKDFDDYGKNVAYYLEKDSDISAVEKKTGARLTVDGQWKKANAVSHQFNGGKVKLSNNKLGKIDASQGSEDVVIGEGTIKVTEPISKVGFTLSATGDGKAYVTAVRMFVNGDEFEAKKSGTDFTFSNVEIAESGKIQFKVDILDNDNASGSFTLTPNFNGDSFKNSRYDNSRDDVNTGDVSGAISFSTITIQAAKASLKNSLTKAVEFLDEDTNEGVVFDGTYTAKKALINLNKFYMSGSNPLNGVKITYNLYLGDDEDPVASVDAYGSGAEEIFNDVEVEPGKSIKVKVVAEVEAYGDTGTVAGVQLVLGGTDEFGKDVEYKAAKLMDMKVVEKGAAAITAGETSKTVLRKAKNQVLAQFTVKPADGASSVEIEEISFNLGGAAITTDDISVMFGSTELDPDNDNSTTFSYSDINETIKDAVTVKVILDEEKAGTISLSGVVVNTKTLNKEFLTRFEEALVKIVKQEDLGGTTKFTVRVDADSDVTVSDLMYGTGSTPNLTGIAGDFNDGATFEVKGIKDDVQFIESLKYSVDTGAGATPIAAITKDAFNDFFKVGETYAKVFQSNTK